MKFNIILLTVLMIFCFIKSQGQIYTPTGVSVGVEIEEEFSDPQIAAGDSIWQDSIINAGWSADIISSCSAKYNCHGYAWHMSDGGDTTIIRYEPEVVKYFNGTNSTYKKVNGTGKYRKIYYNGAQHSAIVDPDYTNWVISKWGSGPLVRHLPDDCPFNDQYEYILEYYELIIDSLPSSVAKGCATDVSTLDINNATYSWAGIDSYVCASGNTYTGEITGLNTTPGVAKGKVKVEITSPYSNTTVKGIKEFTVTSQPSAPYVSGPTLVCSSGAAFTLNNVPAGNTITWTSSSNLSTSDAHANPCTFVSTGNGSGWVKADVSTGCTQNMFTVNQLDVWSGVPVFSYISGPLTTPNNQWATYYVEPYNANMDLQNNDYTWTLNPLNGNALYNYGRSLDIAFYNSGYYQLVVRAENTCGTGDYTGTSLYVYDSRSLSVSPNPGSGEVTLSIESSDEKELLALKEWNLEIYSSDQSLKEKKDKITGKEYKINTSDWEEGIYYVKVLLDDEILTGKLVVKK